MKKNDSATRVFLPGDFAILSSKFYLRDFA